MMTVGVYFRIRDLITSTLQENVTMAKCGRYLTDRQTDRQTVYSIKYKQIYKEV